MRLISNKYQTTVTKCNEEMTFLSRDKETFETQLLKANSKIEQLQKSVNSGQNEIVRLTAALNEKDKELLRLNAAYNESIKLLDEKKQGSLLLILVITDLERQLAIENQYEENILSLTTRIGHPESSNLDLKKSSTELNQEYQVNVKKLHLENTDYKSNMHDLGLKLRQAIVDREEVEGLNRVLFIVLKRTS
jgi:hypothetical protein